MKRREFLGAAGALTLAPALGSAQSAWPTRPIRMVVPTGPGSSLDLIVRAMSDRLKDRLGQPIVVDNKPGGGGLIGTDLITEANDGHTFGISFNGPLAYAPFLYSRMPYRLPEDVAPIILTTSQPNVLAVNSQVPVKNVKELVEWLKQRPGKVNYASIGNGSSSHLSMELFKTLTGTFVVHIPYSGSPPSALSVASGETQLIMTVAPAMLPHVQAGKVRLLAVTGKTRSPSLPDLPTIAESGVAELKNYEAIAWNGIIGPANTPADIVKRLNAEIDAALKDPAVRQRLTSQGMDPAGGTPDVLGKLMAEENKKWGPIIKRTGAKLD